MPLRLLFTPASLISIELLRVSTVVAQQLRWSIEIRDQQIDIAVVIDVAKRDAAADAILSQDRTKLRRYFSECRVAIVPVQQSRLAIPW